MSGQANAKPSRSPTDTVSPSEVNSNIQFDFLVNKRKRSRVKTGGFYGGTGSGESARTERLASKGSGKEF